LPLILSRKPEIRDFDAPIVRDEEILRLQVAMNDGRGERVEVRLHERLWSGGDMVDIIRPSSLPWNRREVRVATQEATS